MAGSLSTVASNNGRRTCRSAIMPAKMVSNESCSTIVGAGSRDRSTELEPRVRLRSVAIRQHHDEGPRRLPCPPVVTGDLTTGEDRRAAAIASAADDQFPGRCRSPADVVVQPDLLKGHSSEDRPDLRP